MMKMTAPVIDRYIRFLDDRNCNPINYPKTTNEKILKLYSLLDRIEPNKEGDNVRILYFRVPKGTIEDYGDYKELKNEGEVKNYKEFEKNYFIDYPDDYYWYRLSTVNYKNYYVISINNKGILYADVNEVNDYYKIFQLEEFLDFLIDVVLDVIEKLENNTYNDYVENNLSYKNKYGVIKRSDYWKLYPEVKKSMLEEITQENIDRFVDSGVEKTNLRIKKMTAQKYYEIVYLAYKSNGYNLEGLTPKEAYIKYVEMRDNGLRNIDDNASHEFDKWYEENEMRFDHTFEIMPGHSYSRLDLWVSHDEDGYYMCLDGKRILRKTEIANIYLILKDNNIPVEVYNIDVVKKALKGEDYLGGVPKYLFLVYCESDFDKYKPLEFVHVEEKMLDYMLWEDIEKAYLK